MRLRTLRWLAPLGLVVVLSPACSNGADDASETTLAPSTTVVETTTTTSPTTTAGAVALEGLGPFEVTSTVVSHETTRDIGVWSPEEEGSWPVVYMTHGYGAKGQDLAEMATRLASHGNVVFAPDYRTDDSQTKMVQDLECGYRYARSIAHEYGGDLDQPVTFIGDSYGASMAIAGGVDQALLGPGGSYDVCFTGVPRADVVVAIGGCYYEHEGEKFPSSTVDGVIDNIDTAKRDTELILVVGEDDDVCQAWQSEDATEALAAAGYDARVVVVPGGNHNNVVFWGGKDGDWVTVPNDPIGREVLQIILDAIDAAQQ